jgi:hypothetical protein
LKPSKNFQSRMVVEKTTEEAVEFFMKDQLAGEKDHI